jgi:vacuolar-type H+-ATPase catalytic subunit A/Vma1
MKSTIHEYQKNNLLSVSKKSIFMLAILAGTTFTSCKNNAEKEADAVEDVVDAKEDLNKVNDDISKDAITKANDAEWQTYKMVANKTISENETRIVELQTAMKKQGKTFDANYKKSIEALEEKNTALKTKIADYENNQTDWDTFKREFDADMQGLGQAFKDLTVNNKK